MNGFALLLATAILGVDYGWQPASDGRLEYIIQIEPITLIALREGQEVVSQIDPLARDVRRFRIRVGTEVVPRLGMPVQGTAPTFSAAAAEPPPGVTYGWQPVNEQQVELIVQLSPERLTALRNEPVVGEIPAELRSVARVRVRSGAANLPRQNVPQFGPPVTAGVAVAGQTTSGTASAPPGDASRAVYGAPATGNPQSRPPSSAIQPGPAPPNGQLAAGATNNPAKPGTAANVQAMSSAAGGANAASGWPSAPATGPADPPRYNPPPSNPPNVSSPAVSSATADLRSGTPANPNYSQAASPPASAATGPQYAPNAWQPPPQNSNWQPQDTPWQAAVGQNPAWSDPQATVPAGQVAAAPGMAPLNPSAVGQPGMSESNGNRPWDGWSATGGNYPNAQPSAVPSAPWGPADDRYTADRGQPQPQGYVPAGASNWGQAYTPSQPPTLSSRPQSGSWPPSLGGSRPQGEMASPFASSAGPDRSFGSSQAPLEPSSDGNASALNDTVFLGKVSKKKPTDFWEELAASADDPSLGFLREGGRVSSLAESDKPWWALTLAMLALFASMGGNLYMGWIAVDVYRRYLEMADEGDDDDEPYDAPRRRDDAEEWEDRPRRRQRVAVED